MISGAGFFRSALRSPAPWTCRACLRKEATNTTRRTYSSTHSTSASPIKKHRRRILLATTGGAIGLGAYSVGDEVQHTAKAAQRTGRVVQTLALNINDYRITLKHDTSNPEEYQALLKACHKRCAVRTLATLEKLGSIFIKLGQHLSSMGYLLPTEWCDTFIPLQDKCPVSSLESIEEMVLKDTGHPLSFFFEEFEEQPIGAASLAQVHRATVRGTGQRVAVKVQHPALDEWAPLDLWLTSFSFATLKRWFPDYDLTWLSDEMQSSLPLELDFNREAENAIRAREYFSHIHDFPLIIPDVVWARRRVLVLEYVTGARPDDLEYLDSHKIDRDEVSAALARIFNEMIFGHNAPLHCDPHGGNIAVRYNPSRWGKSNFDIILYDHGLYRDIPTSLRRSYAKLWLAVLEADEPQMRKYAKEVAGIQDAHFPLFASAITGRDFNVVRSSVTAPRTVEEKETISDALGEGMLPQLIQLLGEVPRVLLLILKTNDLTRALDENLHTRYGPMRTFLILARYASRTVYEEQLDSLRGSILWPTNFLTFLRAWSNHTRIELKLALYESWLGMRVFLGFEPLST